MNDTKTTYPKFYKDFEYAEKLFEIAKNNAQIDGYTLHLISWDESVKVDFQYFTEYKGWPAKGYRVKFPTDKTYSERNTRMAAKHEIIGYLAQFRLVGDNGSNE